MNRKDGLREYIPRDEDTKKGISSSLGKVDDNTLEADLKPFMPTNFQPIIKTLKSSLLETFKL